MPDTNELEAAAAAAEETKDLDGEPGQGDGLPGDGESHEDAGNGEPDGGDDGDAGSDIDDYERERRAAQSEKDRVYSLQKEVDRLKVELAVMQQAGAKAPAKSQESSKSEQELSQYAAKLKRRIEDGELTQIQAQELFSEKKQSLVERDEIIAKLNETNARVNFSTGAINVNEVRRQIRSLGIPKGTPLEKEIFFLLKRDSSLDVSKPETFADLSVDSIETIVSYTAAFAEKKMEKRKGGSGGAPPGKKSLPEQNQPRIRQSAPPPEQPKKLSFKEQWDELRRNGI